MKGSRSESSGASLQTEARRPVWLIDLALVATTGLMLATDLTVLCFHIIFVLLTFGAFFWEFKAFAWRAALWVLFAATVVFLEVLDGTLPFDEIIEIPLLTTILVLVFLIARRRAQAQTRLKEQDEAFLGAVLENMEEGVVAAGPDGRLAFSNRAARTIHGLPEDEPPLERWTDYYELRTEGGDQVSGENAPIMRALRGEKIKDEEVLISPSNGPERYLLVSGNRMVSSLGRTLGAVVVMRDITERKRAEKRLIEVQEDERERIARDLHDAVLQDLSWAVRKIEYDRRTSSGDAAMVSTSEQVVAALRRAVQGVRNSIYDLRPREASKRSFAELLESVLEMNREISPEIEFESVVDGFPLKLPHPMGAEVLKVVQEALVNARRHSSASRVRIILRTEEDDLLVCVEDDGTGFEPEAAPGLGISGMRERAEKLGGGLEIQSHPAEGTRICLTIPRMPPKLSGPASEVLDRWNHMLEGSVRSRL